MGLKTNALYSSQRSYDSLGNTNETSDSRLQDMSLTGQYQLTNNHKSLPDSLIFGEVSVYDNTDGLEPVSGSSALVGGTVYTVNDPIVLSLTGSYQYNGTRDLTDTSVAKEVDIGDVVSVNGSVGFAVNPDITLTTGIGWQSRQADELQGLSTTSTRQTQTNLNLGMAYALSERSNLTANASSNISGEGGSTVSVGLTTKLGKLPAPLSERYSQLAKPEPNL